VEFPGRILVEVADDEVVLDMADICLRYSQRTSCCEDLESNVVFFVAKVGTPFVGLSCQPFLMFALFRS
jgi:hypothetical protein